MTSGTGGDRALEMSVSHRLVAGGIWDSTLRQKPLFHAGYGARCVIQNIDYSIIELAAIFGLFEITIELAKLTTISRFGNALGCRLGLILDSDFAARLTFAVMSQKSDAAARWRRQSVRPRVPRSVIWSKPCNERMLGNFRPSRDRIKAAACCAHGRRAFGMRELKNSQANTMIPTRRGTVARWHAIRPAAIGQDRI
jgi:hypothetical protein